MGYGKLKCGSGKAHQCTAVQAKIKESREVVYPDLSFDPPPLYVRGAIYPIGEGKLLKERHAYVPVTNKWIYVFIERPSRTRGSYISLHREIWADKSGSYYTVNWSDSTRDDYINRDERPKASKRTTISLELESATDKVFICTSRIPLPAIRLKQFLGPQGTSHVVKRCSAIDLSSAISSSDAQLLHDSLNAVYDEKSRTYTLHVPSHLDITEHLQKEYATVVNDYNKTLDGHQTKSELALLMTVALHLADDYRRNGGVIDNYLKYDELVRDDWSLHKDLYVSNAKKEFWASRLTRWMDSEGFRETAIDFWSGDADIKDQWVLLEGAISEDLHLSESGVDHYKREVKRADSLLNKFTEQKSDPGKKRLDIVRRGARSVDAVAGWLNNYFLAAIRTDIELAYKKLLPTLTDVLGVEDSVDDLVSRYYREKKFIYNITDDVGKLRLEKIDKAVINKERFWKWAKRSNVATEKLGLLLHVVNTGFTLMVLVEHRKKSRFEEVKAYISFANASLQLIGSFKAYIKGLKHVGFVGALLGVVSDGMGLIGALRGETRAATVAGYGFIAVGSALLLFNLANPFAVVGLVLYLFGTYLVLVFQDTPLEKWFKSSPWGTSRDSGSKTREQLEGILHLIGEPRVEVQVSMKDGKTKTTSSKAAEYVSLKVRPAFFLEGETQFKIHIKLSEFVATLMESIELPMKNDLIVYSKKGHVEEIIHNWKLSETGFQFVDRNFEFEYGVQPKFLSSWPEYSKKGYGGQKYVDLGLG